MENQYTPELTTTAWSRYRALVTFSTSSSVRSHLVHALEAELVGPYAEREELDRAPSRTYLTGFLVPRGNRNTDPLNDRDDDTETEEAEADGELARLS